jgi:hypothetical protein
VKPPSRRGRVATLLSMIAVVTLLTASTASAAFPTTRVLRVNPDQLMIAMLASDRGVVVAGWQEPDLTLAMKVSHDGGATFGSRILMGQALSAAVDICGGLIVVERWDGSAIKLDLRSVDGRIRSQRTLSSGQEYTYGAWVSCVGTRRALVQWIVNRNGAWHLQARLVPLLEPLPGARYDLGVVPQYEIFGTTGTDDGAWVTWQRGDDLMVRRFDVADDDLATVTPHPARVIATVPEWMASPRIGASGDRVYVSWAEQGGVTLLSTSTDRGDTFGEPQVILDPAGGPISGPADLHASGDEVLLGVHQGAWGDVGDNWGEFSTDGGLTWTAGPASAGGYQVDTLVHQDGVTTVAELWDDRTLDIDPHRIRFHVGTI